MRRFMIVIAMAVMANFALSSLFISTVQAGASSQATHAQDVLADDRIRRNPPPPPPPKEDDE